MPISIPGHRLCLFLLHLSFPIDDDFLSPTLYLSFTYDYSTWPRRWKNLKSAEKDNWFDIIAKFNEDEDISSFCGSESGLHP